MNIKIKRNRIMNKLLIEKTSISLSITIETQMMTIMLVNLFSFCFHNLSYE